MVSGSKDKHLNVWDSVSGSLLFSLIQDAEITCLSLYPLIPGMMSISQVRLSTLSSGDSHVIFGDGESKMSLLSIQEESPALHLMPNVQVGTGRYRRSHKYHDKSVDKVWVADNGYMVTVSTGSKFVKIWKVREEDS